MTAASYYNEIDPFAAQWLRELIKAGLIADGEVDERSITDVRPGDLRGFAQCHFFAGIGGWSAALRLAGWSDASMVWTGSCPCQPFSSAGKGGGKDDARHLWPQFRRLIRQCRPPVVFGEQVASAAGRTWLSAVFADFEALAYRAAGADLCGPSVGAFDIRQRLWFVADTTRQRHERQRLQLQQRQPRLDQPEAVRGREAGSLDDAELERAGRGAGGEGRPERASQGARQDEGRGVVQAFNAGAASSLGNANGAGLPERDSIPGSDQRAMGAPQREATERASATSCAWSDADWIPCSDGKARPVEPGTFPLADGVPARVGRLRGYGNAIKPQVAAAFIQAYLEATGVTA